MTTTDIEAGTGPDHSHTHAAPTNAANFIIALVIFTLATVIAAAFYFGPVALTMFALPLVPTMFTVLVLITRG